MKTRIHTCLIAFALLGSTLMLNSCSKDDDTNNTNKTPPKANSMGATIGTDVLNPTGAPIVKFEADKGNLDFTVTDKNQVTALAIYMNINGANVQNFGTGDTPFANVQTSSTTEGLYEADGGSITLTTNDKTNRIVEGTFAFSAKNTNQENLEVSNGTFYIKY